MKTIIIWLFCSISTVAQPSLHRNTIKIALPTHSPSDQIYYIAGEKIIGQAQIFDATTHQPDSLGDPIYIDFIDLHHGRLVKRLILKPRRGFAHFTLSLPDSLRTGNYQLRAYTNWMRNFSPYAFGRVDLLVLSTNYKSEPLTHPAVAKVNSVIIQPEGGSLIANLRNNLVICTKDTFGIGISAVGIIGTANHDTMVTFQTDECGLTSLEFIPLAATSYWLQIGNKHITLPLAQLQGSVLRCDNIINPDKIRITVQNQYTTPDDSLILVAHNRGHIVWQNAILSTKRVTVFHIPIADLAEGITNLSLLNRQRKIICERMIYKLPIVEVSDSDWLSLELDEPINPKLTNRQLSQTLVLRRNILFSWHELVTDRAYPFNHEVGFRLSGYVTKWNNKPVGRSVQVSLLATPTGDDSLSQPELLFSTSDDKGHFIFPDLVLYGSYDGRFAAKQGNTDAQVFLDSVDVPSITASQQAINWELLINQQQQALTTRYDTMMTDRQRSRFMAGITLQTVTVKGERAPLQRRAFASKPSARLDKVKVLSGGVGGDIGPIFKQYIAYRLAKYNGTSQANLKFFVDGREVASNDELSTINVGIIDHIDVHDGNSDAFMYGANLIVAIYTIYGSSVSTKVDSGRHIRVIGFQREPTFK